MKVIVGIYFSMLGVNVFWVLEHFEAPYSEFFLSTAQDQSHIYQSHSYNTSDSPVPPVTTPKQEDYAGSRKNGTQEHSVVNFPTSTSDTMTLHSGKAKKTQYVCLIFVLYKTFFGWNENVFVVQHHRQESFTTLGTPVTALSHRLTLMMTNTDGGPL